MKFTKAVGSKFIWLLACNNDEEAIYIILNLLRKDEYL
jgi:hypothetical protein